MPMTISFVILFVVSVWAGIQNALAGGGTFLTLPALMLTGMTALAANITSTVALFPGQLTSSWGGRGHVAGAGGLSFKALVAISAGRRRPGRHPAAGDAVQHLQGIWCPGWCCSPPASLPMAALCRARRTARRCWASSAPARRSSCIAVYGGYFGGGIGFLMLAALTAAGLAIRSANATKNVLAGVMNASAVAHLRLFAPGALAAGCHRLCRRRPGRHDRRPYGQPGQSKGCLRGGCRADRHRPDHRPLSARALPPSLAQSQLRPPPPCKRACGAHASLNSPPLPVAAGSFTPSAERM